ncbi:kinase-like domain-containing protein [Lasiosphaeria ovina]|uniref:Kinase-like domain-containing protein n=1 Tax=Lasiosphaeria ovina TaxID=92902 RepID=A0AAE0MYI6_9PEZI|nr:kinase-like domain-containing protein [Lasiosphaeria ovina]
MNALRLRNQGHNPLFSPDIATAGQRGSVIPSLMFALQDLDEFLPEDLEHVRQLGSGTSFRVVCFRDTDTGKLVAVKTPRQQPGRRGGGTTPAPHGGSEAVLRELKLAAHPPFAQHPGLVRLLGVLEPELEGETIKVSLVYEYSELGTLGDLLGQHHRVWDDALGPAQQRRMLAADMTAGLEALHVSNVVHGDMKPDNILLFPVPAGETTDSNASNGSGTSTGTGSRLMAKLSDFGSAIVEDTIFTTRNSALYQGTPMFTPGWVTEMGGQIPFHLGPLCDLYALGLTIWSMYRGAYFFSTTTPAEQQQQQRPVSSGFSSSSWQSISWLSAVYANDTLLGSMPQTDRDMLDEAMNLCVFQSEFSLTAPIVPLARQQVLNRDSFGRVSIVKAILTGCVRRWPC